MNDEEKDADLKRKLLERSREGTLPRMAVTRAWAGRGNGEACVLCDAPIGSAQIEFEVEWGGGSQARLLRFHELCYRLWSES